MRRRFLSSALAAIWLLSLAGCGGGKLPSRDHIPVINQQVARLEAGIREQNSALIDSLMSVEVLQKQLSADSLLSFAWGPSRSFAFDRLADCEVFLSREFAIVECHLTDTAGVQGGPIKLVWEPIDDTLWLLSGFEEGTIDVDEEESIVTDSL